MKTEIEWKKYPDEKPNEGQETIVYIEGDGIIQSTFKKGEFRHLSLGSHGCGCCGYDYETPSHWAELPETPK